MQYVLGGVIAVVLVMLGKLVIYFKNLHKQIKYMNFEIEMQRQDLDRYFEKHRDLQKYVLQKNSKLWKRIDEVELKSASQSNFTNVFQMLEKQISEESRIRDNNETVIFKRIQELERKGHEK